MRAILYILILFTSTFCKAQHIKKCIVYQISGKNNTKKHIALIQTFNQKGLLTSEIYSNYKKSSSEGNIDGTYHYYYNGTFLPKHLFVALNMDTLKTLYSYNNLKQLIREEYFSCEKSLRKDVEKRMGQPAGCVVSGKDFEKHKTWLKINEVNYSYDENGRRIKKVDELDYDCVWMYDTSGRNIQEKGYSFDRLEYVEDYKYFKGGYKNSRIFYDGNANPVTPIYSDIIFNPIFTSFFCVNTKGKIINEVIITEKGIKISDEKTYYDNAGKIK